LASGCDIQLVCFDLGRVLVRICDGWRHACEVAGVPAPAREPDPAARAALHDLICRVEVAQIQPADFCRDAAPALGMPAADVTAVWNAYTRGTYPGAHELLDELKSAGVATACLSNTNATHWRLMGDPSSHCPFPFDRLTHAFASHLLRLRKPDDAIYARVERATGVAGDRIVFFDDVPENVEAASRRGWHAHRIDPALDDPLPQIRLHLRGHGVLG
jgi:putative hydrolase of the HAD superfamily